MKILIIILPVFLLFSSCVSTNGVQRGYIISQSEDIEDSLPDEKEEILPLED